MAERANEAVQWLPAARAGSPEALGQLLDACRSYLLVVAQRELDPHLQAKGGVSDLVQETLLDALRDFTRFQGDSEPELLAWLRRLLLNNLVSFTRLYRETDKRQVRREVAPAAGDSSNQGPGELAGDLPSPSGQALENEQTQLLHQSIEQLPDDYRRVLHLRYQEELSFEEIGRVMDLTPNAARKLWGRAIKRLQQESEGPS